VGDEKKRATGLPDLPLPWRAYLLPKPVEGRVVRVRGPRVMLNLGVRQELGPGIALWAFGRRTPLGEIRIRTVERDSAIAEPLIADDRICAGDVVRSR
jgi:hypothetical protein